MTLLPLTSFAGLFPTDLPEKEWIEFKAQDFSKKACGMIFSNTHQACCGVPLGGLGTGCLDIETTGVLGFSSIFRPAVRVEPTPYLTLRNSKIYAPFLGLAIDDQTWVLADKDFIAGGEKIGCVDPVEPGKYLENETYMKHWTVQVPEIKDVKPAKSVKYWGHYPVADINFETDAPVKTSLRAWAPFIPGDASASGIPAAVFEVCLENKTKKAQSGTLAFNFPGPHENEVGMLSFAREKTLKENYTALTVKGNRCSYTLGVLGNHEIRFGGNLAGKPNGWSTISQDLPFAISSDPGTSAAVTFSLAPSETQTIRFVLTWYLTHWEGGSYNNIKHFDETWTKNEFILSKYNRHDRTTYYPMYTTRFDSSLAVFENVADQHQNLLQRIIDWQEEIFTYKSLPVWLREALLNNLALFAEDSVWAAPKGEIGHWAYPQGAYYMTESPRACAITGCTASDYYGDLPIAYFFPELERQILRSYVVNMRPDGAIPFLYPSKDITKPAYEWQVGLNGACFTDLVHRLWLRTNDRTILQEFYPAVKKSAYFTVNLAQGPHGIISFHREGHGQEWWEHTPVFGMVTHLAGVRMAQLQMAKNMALKLGDDKFVKQCDQWLEKASDLTEDNLWNDETKSYAFYVYTEKDMRSDDIMSSQLDGQWMVDLHGLPRVFRKDRIQTALDTIARTCMVDMGVAGFADPAVGRPDLARYGTFPPETHIVAMTYMYNGHKELGLEIARRNVNNMVKVHGYSWDLPNLINCEDGHRTFGCDYYQNMVLWGLPAAVAGEDLSGPCKPGGLVFNVLNGSIN